MKNTVEVKCATCGKAKKISSSQHEKSKSKIFCCSIECKGKAMTTSVKRSCTWCEKELEVQLSRLEKFNQFFCNKTCRGLFERKRVKVNCDWCKKELELRPSEVASYQNHFCDMDCRKAWQSVNIRGEVHHSWKGGKKFTLHCAWCESEIPVHEHRIGSYEAIFCGKECRSKFLSQKTLGENNSNWKGGKIQVPCDGCGTMLSIRPGDSCEHHFCSKECMGKIMSGPNSSRWGGGPVELRCIVCQKDFFVKRSGAEGGSKFCSHECAGKFRQNGIEVLCTFCGKSVYRNQSGLQPIQEGRLPFCDRKCKHLYFIGENSPNWNGGTSFEPYSAEFVREIRFLIRDRDGHICQLCGKEENGISLAVHHIDYCKQNDDEMNLISLCQHPCHQKTNTKREYWENFFTQFMKSRFLEP